MNVDGEILRLEAASVADIADDRDVVGVAKQRVCRFKQKRVATMILAAPLSVVPACATVFRDARPDSGMPQMGCGGLCRRLLPAEIIRGQSSSRRHSETGIQNSADQTGNIRVIDIRSGAFRFSLVVGAKAGLS